MAEFNPLLDSGKAVKVEYQAAKLIREAFPSLATSVLYKIDGFKDAAKDAVSNLYNGFKPNLIEGKTPLSEYNTSSPSVEAAVINWDNIVPLEVNQGNVKSYLGLPVFMPVYFMPGTYKYLDNGTVKQRAVKDIFMLPAATLCEFDREKIIELIQLNGANGTEKELWAFGDWQINIRGFILDDGDRKFPERTIAKLGQYEQFADSISVAGGLFDVLKIRRLVVKKFSIGQVQGSPFKLSYQLQCISDEVPESRIKNSKL